MPTPPSFAQVFSAYLISARAAQAENRHHDYRRGLFLDLLRGAFGIRAAEVDVEQFVRIDMRRRGWIDALFPLFDAVDPDHRGRLAPGQGRAGAADFKWNLI